MEAGAEIKIPTEIDKMIEEISEETGNSKDKIIIEALLEYIAEYEDYEEALERYKNKKDKLLSSAELRDSLGL